MKANKSGSNMIEEQKQEYSQIKEMVEKIFSGKKDVRSDKEETSKSVEYINKVLFS